MNRSERKKQMEMEQKNALIIVEIVEQIRKTFSFAPVVDGIEGDLLLDRMTRTDYAVNFDVNHDILAEKYNTNPEHIVSLVKTVENWLIPILLKPEAERMKAELQNKYNETVKQYEIVKQ